MWMAETGHRLLSISGLIEKSGLKRIFGFLKLQTSPCNSAQTGKVDFWMIKLFWKRPARPPLNIFERRATSVKPTWQLAEKAMISEKCV